MKDFNFNSDQCEDCIFGKAPCIISMCAKNKNLEACRPKVQSNILKKLLLDGQCLTQIKIKRLQTELF